MGDLEKAIALSLADSERNQTGNALTVSNSREEQSVEVESDLEKAIRLSLAHQKEQVVDLTSCNGREVIEILEDDEIDMFLSQEEKRKLAFEAVMKRATASKHA